jgi:1-deoxy-D-xylulose-5-phosphate reductoisomerase
MPEILHGPEGILAAALHSEVHLLVSAIVGVAGLPATYEAVRRGIHVALANKEVLVAGGALVTAAARASGARLLPVDSEHNGVHQCLRAGERHEVRRLILTASGGPFRNTPAADLESVTPQQALHHPTWRMGNRITIDSATLMNKGFEVIEACWLFGLRPEQVDVLVHPQSTVHCLVEFTDGSLVAQLSVTDMRLPIQYALTYPERWEGSGLRLDLEALGHLEFEKPDLERFPCLGLAYQALRLGGAYPCVLNAADEVAVEAFLAGKITFPGIARTIADTLEAAPAHGAGTLEDLLEADRQARLIAARRLARAVSV